MFYFSIVANAMRYHIDGSAQATGSLMGDEDHWGPGDGEVEIIVSCTRPDGCVNWLRLEPDASVIIIRQSALDLANERSGEYRIERIGGPPALQTAYARAAGSERAGGGATRERRRRDFSPTGARLFRANPNQFPEIDQTMFQKGGGAKDIYWRPRLLVAWPEDEAWVIEVTPPDCYYWNFQLDNWWMEIPPDQANARLP